MAIRDKSRRMLHEIRDAVEQRNASPKPVAGNRRAKTAPGALFQWVMEQRALSEESERAKDIMKTNQAYGTKEIMVAWGQAYATLLPDERFLTISFDSEEERVIAEEAISQLLKELATAKKSRALIKF